MVNVSKMGRGIVKLIKMMAHKGHKTFTRLATGVLHL